MRTIWTRLTALGFAIGSATHTLGFILLFGWGIQWYGPTYPGWRHVVMALVDASIVGIGLKRPSWFVFVLCAFLVEQLVVNGFHLMSILLFAAAILAGRERWFLPPSFECLNTPRTGTPR